MFTISGNVILYRSIIMEQNCQDFEPVSKIMPISNPACDILSDMNGNQIQAQVITPWRFSPDTASEIYAFFFIRIKFIRIIEAHIPKIKNITRIRQSPSFRYHKKNLLRKSINFTKYSFVYGFFHSMCLCQ